MNKGFIAKIPKCCGRAMEIRMETPRFLELCCSYCDDAVYVKKDYVKGPQLLDD